jgi:DNA repair protein RadC
MTDLPANFSIKRWPEGERPREKLIQYGAESLTDAELLAILLRVGKAGSSAIDMGRQLIDKLNGICGIDRAHVEDLLKFKGLGLAKTAQLKAAIEIGKRVRRQNALPASFDSADTIAAFCFPKFEGKRHEIFLALHLQFEGYFAESVLGIFRIIRGFAELRNTGAVIDGGGL